MCHAALVATLYLTRWEQTGSERNHTVIPVRPVSDEEVERVHEAIGIVALMNGNNLLKSAANATDELLRIACHVLEQPTTRATAVDTRQDWSAALDTWLMHVAMVRRRTEREVNRSLGSAAHSQAKAIFQHLYNTDADFRLSWEWRNVAQHDANPLELTAIRVERGTDGRVETQWSIDASLADRFPAFGNDVCGPRAADSPDCFEVIGATMAALESALTQVFLLAETRIAAAARLIFELVGEAVSGVTSSPASDGRAEMLQVAAVICPIESPDSLSMLPLRYDLASHALLTLDAAREFTGKPKVHTVV